MIVPMKKVTLATLDRDREANLGELRRLGVMHLEKRAVAPSPALGALLERRGRLQQALGILRLVKAAVAAPDQDGVPPEDPVALAELVIATYEERKRAFERLALDGKDLSRIQDWGRFDPAGLAGLAARGVSLIPYEFARRDFQRLSEEVKTITVTASATMVRCLVLAQGPLSGSLPPAGQQPCVLPPGGIAGLEDRMEAGRQAIARADILLSRLAAGRSSLEQALAGLLAAIEFETAACGMEDLPDAPAGLGVSWLSGYVPVPRVAELVDAGARAGWALAIRDPVDSDPVPTKVENNPLVRIIQPVFDLLGTVPGYREPDISLWFLLFFSVFFAMIFGDAGYGSLLLVGAIVMAVRSKIKKGRVPDALRLLVLLSSCTLAWGAMSGTWFAIPQASLPEFLRALIIPPFADPDPKLVQQNIKLFCFILGTVQISLAHVKNIRRAFPSLTCIAQLGWLAMVVSLFFVVLNLVLDRDSFPVPPWALWGIIGGFGLYFIFAYQNGGNFFKNILTSLAQLLPTFLSAISSFSDIISYIRLFAVGLAGFAIADSFNAMATALPAGAARILAGAVILLFGHGLNILMSTLSVVVHGIRLNMLEFSGHLGMEWSGIKYRPFADEGEKTET